MATATTASAHGVRLGAQCVRFLPDLIQLIWDCTIDPGKVFDLTLPLEQAEGYKAISSATKVLTL